MKPCITIEMKVKECSAGILEKFPFGKNEVHQNIREGVNKESGFCGIWNLEPGIGVSRNVTSISSQKEVKRSGGRPHFEEKA